MPELPEVETIVRELDEVLVGKVIARVEVLRRTSFKGNEQSLVGKKIDVVNRKAKMIVVEFKNWDKVVVIHLKMTGQLVWRSRPTGRRPVGRSVVGGHPTADWLNKLPSKHTRVVISFEDGSKLFFNDMRIFGWMKLIHNLEFAIMKKKLPPDVTDKEFSLKYFREVLAKGNRAIKLVIMDQTKIGGLGNIYACDALWEASIAPDKKAVDLNNEEVERLYKAIKKVIGLGIKHKGATYSDFVSSRGIGGKYQEHFKVYGREGEKCKRCGEEIKKIKLGGRGTYFCPKCQA